MYDAVTATCSYAKYKHIIEIGNPLMLRIDPWIMGYIWDIIIGTY